MIRCNLVLIHRGPGHARDVSDTGRKVITRDPSIAVFHLALKLKVELPTEAWSHPTPAALPDLPVLGIDMIREEGTGELFALECNAGGNTWYFTSEIGSGVRDDPGCLAPDAVQRNEIGRQMLVSQFGAFDIAAEVLVRKTAELAA